MLLAPYGTRGDVQPLVALGMALRARGHSVLLTAQNKLGQWIESFGVPFHPAGGTADGEARGEIWQAHLQGRSRRELTRLFAERLIPLQFETLWPVSEGADLIVGMGLQIAGSSIAERRRIPYVSALYGPKAIPSGYMSPPFIKAQSLPRVVNRLIWRLFLSAGDRVLRAPLNQRRAILGLPSVRHPSERLSRDVVVLAADPVLAPPPPDAPPNVRTTGPWLLDEPGEIDKPLEQFLAEGPPPVLVAFGSMMSGDPRQLVSDVIEAGARAECRLLLQGGWVDEGAKGVILPRGSLRTGPLPHHLVLPRVAAVVHHGGAGTTTTVARAGVPQVVVPHIAEQHYWGRRVHLLGLGPAPLPVRALTPRRLATRLKRVASRPRFRERARRVGDTVRSSNGTGEAVLLLEALYEGRLR